ncbi:MAG: hypothetical protein KAR42_15130 [candidate division Zixibacteria bacterium]|nr:hypothetical protein [candidate division Zixibacteria bacterium]
MAGDLDKLLDGISDNQIPIQEFLAQLAYTRIPGKTPILDDADKEWGLIPNPDLSEDERRARLLSAKTSNKNEGTDTFIQEKLRLAGFDVYVHRNNPPINPALFLSDDFLVVCGGSEDATCGEADAVCGSGGAGGDLIVNGDLYVNSLDYLVMCGGEGAICGVADAVCGATSGDINRQLVTYTLPTDSGYWPLVFFVGGLATRDPITDELTSIEFAEIPVSRRDEIVSLIVKYKPAHSWCGILIELV